MPVLVSSLASHWHSPPSHCPDVSCAQDNRAATPSTQSRCHRVYSLHRYGLQLVGMLHCLRLPLVVEGIVLFPSFVVAHNLKACVRLPFFSHTRRHALFKKKIRPVFCCV
jgi:hypothetical protein